MNKKASSSKSSAAHVVSTQGAQIDLANQLQFSPLWRRAWALFWQNWIKIVGVGLAAQAASGVFQTIANGPEIYAEATRTASNVFITTLLSLGALALSQQIGNGLVRYYLQVIREKQTDIGVFTQDPYRIISSFVSSIVFGVIVAVGYVLLIIPGIIWSIKYRYAQWLIVDKRMDLKTAFSTSAAMVDGYKKRIFFLDAKLAIVVLLPLLIELLVVLAAVLAHQDVAAYAWPLTILAIVGAAGYIAYLIGVSGPLLVASYLVYTTLLTHYEPTHARATGA